jgi:UDP:flavonoid glycosyltransferase YjiC (YdhE family)
MRIGFVSLPLTGHLIPMTALARKLQSRGDEVRFIGVPDIEPAVRAANLASNRTAKKNTQSMCCGIK